MGQSRRSMSVPRGGCLRGKQWRTVASEHLHRCQVCSEEAVRLLRQGGVDAPVDATNSRRTLLNWASVLVHLARVVGAKGDAERALLLYREALDVRMKLLTLGPPRCQGPE